MACGQHAVEYADEWKLTAVFENIQSNGEWSRVDALHEIVNRIDRKRFGLLFNIGYVALQCSESSAHLIRQVLHTLERCADRILQLHVHGVQQFEASIELWDHRPLTETNIVDPSPIIGGLQKQSFLDPLIFEIFFPNTGDRRASFQENLQAYVSAKQVLIKHWR